MSFRLLQLWCFKPGAFTITQLATDHRPSYFTPFTISLHQGVECEKGRTVAEMDVFLFEHVFSGKDEL